MGSAKNNNNQFFLFLFQKRSMWYSGSSLVEASCLTIIKFIHFLLLKILCHTQQPSILISVIIM